MNRPHGHDLDEWLAAQLAGDDERADRALARVFAKVGRLEPGAAFAASVLRAAALGHEAPPLSRWWRAAVAACLVCAAVLAVSLPVLLTELPLPTLSQAVASVADGWRLTARAAAWASARWDLVAAVVVAIRESLTSATGAFVVLANVVIAGACLFGLKRLLAAPEEFAQC